VLLAALTLAACTDEGGGDAGAIRTPAFTAAGSPEVTAATSPTATGTRPPRVGVPPQVDGIINLVLARDTDGLAQRVRLTSLACGEQRGPGSPPACPPGQPAGTMVDVLPVATCEGELRPASAVRPTLQDVVGSQPSLFGVYRAPDPYLQPVKGEYVAVFSRQAGGQNLGVGFVIAGDRVLGLWFGCGSPAPMIVPAGTQPVYLPGG
jgi:hypothetical protein